MTPPPIHNSVLQPVEQDREVIVRNHAACPQLSCEAPVKRCCMNGPATLMTSHTGRYYLAADAGLVPQLPGPRVGPPATADDWRERALARLTS